MPHSTRDMNACGAAAEPVPLENRILACDLRDLRCQASSVAGVTGKTFAQRRRGMNRMSAANQARSAGSYRIRPAFRRSTAFSCQSASNSAFFFPSPRITRIARLNNQRISRQTILSSTWPANHHPHQPRRQNRQVSDVIEFPSGTGPHAIGRRRWQGSSGRATRCCAVRSSSTLQVSRSRPPRRGRSGVTPVGADASGRSSPIPSPCPIPRAADCWRPRTAPCGGS
jgi:hypothetical protein